MEANSDSLDYYRSIDLFPCHWLNHAATISSEWPICTFLLVIRCFSSLVSEILLTFRDMANIVHTRAIVHNSWATMYKHTILFIACIGKCLVLQVVHCVLFACKNKTLCIILSRHLSSSKFVY